MISIAAAMMVLAIIATLRRRCKLAVISSYSPEEVVEMEDESLPIAGLSGSGLLGPKALEWSMSIAVKDKRQKWKGDGIVPKWHHSVPGTRAIDLITCSHEKFCFVIKINLLQFIAVHGLSLFFVFIFLFWLKKSILSVLRYPPETSRVFFYNMFVFNY